jgi:hypothetical protein
MDWAALTGILGGSSGLIALVIQIVKQINEDKKTNSDITVDTTNIAGNMIKTAAQISDMYKESLQECKDEIVAVRADTNGQLEVMKQEIRELHNTIDTMSLKDKDQMALIQRLIKGINTLIKQLRDCGMTPSWVPSKDDLKVATE